MSSNQQISHLRERLTNFSINTALVAGFPVMLYRVWQTFIGEFSVYVWLNFVVYLLIGIFCFLRQSIDYRIRASVSIALIFLTTFFALDHLGALSAALISSLSSSILSILILGRRTGMLFALVTCGLALSVAFFLDVGIKNPELEHLSGMEIILKWWPQVIAIFAFYICLTVSLSMIEGSLKRTIQDLESNQAQLTSLNSELIESIEKIEEANDSKSKFLSIISHELRTPLNPIIGYINLMKEEIGDNDILDNLHEMEMSSAHLMRLIDSIIEYVKLDAKLLNSFDVVSLREFGESILEKYQIDRKNEVFDFVLDCPASRNDMIEYYGNLVSLDRITSILLDNAVVFSESGKIRLQIKRKHSGVYKNGIEIQVSDPGLGIAKDEQDKIFDPFYQVQHPNTRTHGGIGLGLAFAKKIVDLLDGEIRVDSKVGFGSRFIVLLPDNPIKQDEQGVAWARPLYQA